MGCEREWCIRVWALVCIEACVCPYVCFYAFSVHALCVHVNVCVYYSTCTCDFPWLLCVMLVVLCCVYKQAQLFQ